MSKPTKTRIFHAILSGACIGIGIKICYIAIGNLVISPVLINLIDGVSLIAAGILIYYYGKRAE